MNEEEAEEFFDNIVRKLRLITSKINYVYRRIPIFYYMNLRKIEYLRYDPDTKSNCYYGVTNVKHLAKETVDGVNVYNIKRIGKEDFKNVIEELKTKKALKWNWYYFHRDNEKIKDYEYIKFTMRFMFGLKVSTYVEDKSDFNELDSVIAFIDSKIK